MQMVEAASRCADRAAQQSAPSGRPGAATDEDRTAGPARLSIVLETTAHEAALILSGRLEAGSLVAFEVAVEQLALAALASVCLDVRALTAVDRAGQCSLRAFGQWARDRGMTLRVEAGGPSGSSALDLVLDVALREVSPAEHMAHPIVPAVASRSRRTGVDEHAFAPWGA